jgi:hypothetical protein
MRPIMLDEPRYGIGINVVGHLGVRPVDYWIQEPPGGLRIGTQELQGRRYSRPRVTD